MVKNKPWQVLLPPKKPIRFQGLGAKFWWFEEGRLSSTYRGLFPTPWERDGWFDRTLGDQFSTWYSRCIAGSFGGSSTWRFAGVQMERGWCLIGNVDPNSTKLPESPWEMVNQSTNWFQLISKCKRDGFSLLEALYDPPLMDVDMKKCCVKRYLHTRWVQADCWIYS